MGIREREAKSIAKRKNTLAVKLANVAEIGAERIEEMIGKASLHDTTIATGVATDKVIALTSQTPSINIVNFPMPTAGERAEMCALDRKLDAIAAKLKASRAAALKSASFVEPAAISCNQSIQSLVA